MRWRGLDWRCGCDADRSATACCAARHAGRPPALSSGFPVLLTLRGRPRPVPVFSGESFSTPASGGCTRAFPQLFRDSLFYPQDGRRYPPSSAACPPDHPQRNPQPPPRVSRVRRVAGPYVLRCASRGAGGTNQTPTAARYAAFAVSRAGWPCGRWAVDAYRGWSVAHRPQAPATPANAALHGQNGLGGRVTCRTLTLLRNAYI
jgi:hypothetical protein